MPTTPGERDATRSGRQVGGVQILYAGPTGLTATGSQLWRASSRGIEGSAGADLFSASLAAGDFGANGAKGRFDDLAIGVPHNNSGATASGAVPVIYGSSGGLVAAGSQYWMASTPGLAGDPHPWSGFGYGLAAGAFKGGSYEDLVIGVPGDPQGELDAVGRVQRLVAGVSGLSTAGAQSLAPRDLGFGDEPGFRWDNTESLGFGFGVELAAN